MKFLYSPSNLNNLILIFIYFDVSIRFPNIHSIEELIIIINCCAIINYVGYSTRSCSIFFFLHLFQHSPEIHPPKHRRFSNYSNKKGRREEGRNAIDGEFVSGLSFRSLSRLPSDYVRLTNVNRTREPHDR